MSGISRQALFGRLNPIAYQSGLRVIRQQHGLDIIARRIQNARAKLDNPNKPIGVFMRCGTSGVGKTETALAPADLRRVTHAHEPNGGVEGDRTGHSRRRLQLRVRMRR